MLVQKGRPSDQKCASANRKVKKNTIIKVELRPSQVGGYHFFLSQRAKKRGKHSHNTLLHKYRWGEDVHWNRCPGPDGGDMDGMDVNGQGEGGPGDEEEVEPAVRH